jgi:FKBP-type peptidyl-prolyl cis-trans isomerase
MFGRDMRGLTIWVLLASALACGGSGDEPSPSSAPGSAGSASAGSGSAASGIKPVAAPFDVKTPPADATKTASGLIYKKVAANDAGTLPKRNDVVHVHYTAWKQSSGETFFTTRGRAEPMSLNLSQTAPGFTEGLQLIRKGEKAMLWIPPEIGYKAAPSGGGETLVYEFEVLAIEPAPAVPTDVAKPPDSARSLPSGSKFLVVRPGTGDDKPRPYDTVTFHYTAWDAQGRMIDTTETLKRNAVTAQPFKQSAAMAEVLGSMTAGERARFWIDAEKMARSGKAIGGIEHGLLCYEVEVEKVVKPPQEPPPAPPDVAKPPPGAKKSPKGVFYRVVKTGTSNERPQATASVRVNYTGWHTNGELFDSSAFKGEPAQFNLGNVIAGWTDAMPLMQIGDHWILWVPEELAYKSQPSKPQGMLVFDVELVGIVGATSH